MRRRLNSELIILNLSLSRLTLFVTLNFQRFKKPKVKQKKLRTFKFFKKFREIHVGTILKDSVALWYNFERLPTDFGSGKIWVWFSQTGFKTAISRQMSQSNIDDCDRDPRRVRDRPGDPLFIPELPLKTPAVNDAIRFRMPYNYKSKSKTFFDKTDQSVGDTFVSQKTGQTKSATFSRRDDPTGSTVAESLQDRRLRMNSYSHMLPGEGRRHSVQFRDWGYNRDIQRRRQNVDIQEQSRSRINNFNPRFRSPKPFLNRFPHPKPNFTRNHNWIPNKKLSNQLTNHHMTWEQPTETVSGEFGDYLTIRRSNLNIYFLAMNFNLFSRSIPIIQKL